MNTSNSLRELALKASTFSYSPYSKAKVGCALETDTGSIFQGCNIENSSFGGTVCAERVAIWNAISQGQKLIKQIYVYTKDGWPPCGMCLQVMVEFAHPELKITVGNAQKVEKTYLLSELIPQSFTPKHLLKD